MTISSSVAPERDEQGGGGELVLRSTRVVTPEGVRAADVRVAGGTVREVAQYLAWQGPAARRHLVDLGDAVLMPAAIDVHVHVNEPGRTEWEGFATASRAALAGGIGLLVDMPLNSEPVTTTGPAFAAKLRAAREHATVDVAFHAGVVPANADDPRTLGDLALAGAAAFKCFLCDSGLASFPAVGEDDLRRAMTHLARLGRRLLAHAELFPDAPSPRPDHAPPIGRSYRRYLDSRPASAELDAIALLLRLARETGCAIHIVHLATAEALRALAAARAEGIDLSVETCPHYLSFCSEEIADGDTLAKCAPPIRWAANREGLWKGLADGTIDFVATDHSPCPPPKKELSSGDFGAAWGGIASLQLLLPALWTGAAARGFGLERLAEWISARPARWLGLPDRGTIRAGARADLVAWDPERRFVVRGAELQHRHPLTPYEGRELSGVVLRTWIAGRERYREGAVAAASGLPVRIRGGTTAVERLGFERFAVESEELARAALAGCCGSRRWIDEVMAGWPYASVRSLFASGERAFDALGEEDWREAFAPHPRIGDLDSLRRREAERSATSSLERSEQAGAVAASEETLRALADGNAEYESRFGRVFLVCASGRTAGELLDALRSRLVNDPAAELDLAADEQRKITVLRLERLLRARSGGEK